MVVKELHEGPSKGHFATEIMKRMTLDVGCWILDIGGQLCIEMCMIIANLAMHVKEHED